MKKRIAGAVKVAGLAGIVGLASAAQAGQADVELTGRVRVAKTSVGYLVHVDVKNDDRKDAAYGPNVYVRIKDRYGNLVTEQYHRKLYQYYGGTATAPNTLNPRELGYIPLAPFRSSVVLTSGLDVRVKISGEGASNFGTDSKNGTVCQKGTPGCL